MRKSAAEYLKSLEMRVARLERQAEEGTSAEATLKLLTSVLNKNGFSATYDAPSKSVHIDGVMGKVHWRPKNRTQLTKMRPKMRIPYTKMRGNVLMFAPPAPVSSAKLNILPDRHGVILKMYDWLDDFYGERLAHLERQAAYSPKDPTEDPRNEGIINYLYTNGRLRFTKKGDRSGRAGIYFYLSGLFGKRGRSNPPFAIYLSGRKIALMKWGNGKWVTLADSNLKPIRSNPSVLSRWVDYILENTYDIDPDAKLTGVDF